jgi:predicted permease
MVVIGLRLADMNFEGCFKDKYLYLFLGLRHIALPFIMVLILKLLPLFGMDIHPAVTTVVVIMASAPAATSATMFAEMYSCDASYVSRAVTISTLLSIVTMPLMTMLI